MIIGLGAESGSIFSRVQRRHDAILLLYAVLQNDLDHIPPILAQYVGVFSRLSELRKSPSVDGVFGLADVNAALQKVAGRGSGGKTVLSINSGKHTPQ